METKSIAGINEIKVRASLKLKEKDQNWSPERSRPAKEKSRGGGLIKLKFETANEVFVEIENRNQIEV